MFEKLIAKLLGTYSIGSDLQLAIAMEIKEKKMRKKDKLLKPGTVPENFYFVTEGVLRHYTEVEGELCTTRFVKAGEFLMPAKFIMGQIRFPDGLEALTDGKVYYLPFSALEKIEKIEGYVEFRKNLTQDYFLWEEDRRGYYFNFKTDDDRVKAFAQKEPGILNVVPDYHIASYQGMTAAQFSIVKNRLGLD